MSASNPHFTARTASVYDTIAFASLKIVGLDIIDTRVNQPCVTSGFGYNSPSDSPRHHVRNGSAASTGRCNTGVESFCWRFKLQCFSWPFVELTSHFIQMGLRVYRQVGSLGEILSQQAIGVLIGAPLPGASRIAEVNIDVGRGSGL
jgi:hypothetical protein